MSVMVFNPNDPVYVAALGKGVIRETRNREHYLVQINGLGVVASSSQLQRLSIMRPRRRRWYVTAARRHDPCEQACAATGMIDLHGNSVYGAIELVIEFLNEALLAGVVRVRIIHGRSSDKIKVAVHGLLKVMPMIRDFGLDKHNPGVTVVRL